MLRSLGISYAWSAGLQKEAVHYIKEAFLLDGDSIRYYVALAQVERSFRNYDKSIEMLLKGYIMDSTNIYYLAWLAYDNYMLDKSAESMKYTKKYENRLEELPWLYYSAMKRIGYVYWESSKKAEAAKWFDKQKTISEEALKMGRYYSIDAYYDLSAVYAFLGDKKNAYKNLKEIAKVNKYQFWLISAIQSEPLFDKIRNEQEFQQIVSDMESKYQAEHERVKKWLEEQAML